jgi:hypothetical protein
MTREKLMIIIFDPQFEIHPNTVACIYAFVSVIRFVISQETFLPFTKNSTTFGRNCALFVKMSH